MPEIVARWQDWATQGLEHLVLREDSTGSLAESTVIGDADGERFAARYHIECDRDWRGRHVELSLIGRAVPSCPLDRWHGQLARPDGTLPVP